LSRKIFKPFKQAMEAIRHFSLQQKQPIKLSPTTTKEFKELNGFLQKMIDKAVEDYTAVKEFSENASHELQTPLAVIQSKLDLLAETNIDSAQSTLIVDMQNAIQKLNRINRSLTLLTRLENHEYATESQIKFCRVTKDVMAFYTDRISLKGITVNSQLGSNVLVKIHPTLAEILVSNLIMNSIRHNVEGGVITTELTQKHFCISNTGLAPEIPTEELFQRFKKSNQSSDNIGLGLAIVKQICEVSQFAVFYQYQDGWHRITVCFDKTASPVLEEPFVQQAGAPALATS
jgi:two-component system, OmpR family, sensor histidine kinase QseC